MIVDKNRVGLMHCIWSASVPMATSATDVGQQRPQMSHPRKLASFEGEVVQKVVIQRREIGRDSMVFLIPIRSLN